MEPGTQKLLWISLQFQHINATTQFKLKDQNVTIIVCRTDINSAPIGEGIEIHFFSVLLNIINDIDGFEKDTYHMKIKQTRL